MPNNILTITNADLKDQLEKSFIDPDQKKELEALIPQMTSQERQELVELISRSIEEEAKAAKENDVKLAELNKEYEGKINNLVKETTEAAYKEAEKTEAQKDADEINAVEGEIVNVPDTIKPVQQTKTIKKHTFRNLFILFMFLLVIAGGALYALQFLSTAK